METTYDGFVSRHLNRRISRPIARVLAHTPVTPNQVSIGSLALALASFFSFLYGQYIVAALLAQVSSIVDGVDGDLARRKNMTSAFGGFMDSILDRYADALILLGLTIWAAGDDASKYVWITGFWALVGALAVSYTRARLDRAPRNLFDSGITSAASRDVRLFVLMVGTLTGYGFATLIALAALTNPVVLLRLLYMRRVLKQTKVPPSITVTPRHPNG